MSIQNFLDKFDQLDKKPIICVIGDFLIDEWYDCIVERISPEAGVPILLTHSSRPSCVKPGGAGLVASFASEFSDCTLFCLKDDYDLDTKFKIVSVNVKQTPLKRRFVSDSVIYPRWDVENENYGENDLEFKRNELLNRFIDFSNDNKIDAVLLSDYDKGLLSEDFAQKIIKHCNVNDILILSDPKSHPLTKWSGIDVIKPNRLEAEILSDTNDTALHESKIKEIIKCKYVVITSKGDGVYGSVDVKPGKKIYPKSVSGGGDNFLVLLGLSLVLGFDIQESSEIAYESGKCYVQNNFRNKVLTITDLEKYVDRPESKIVFGLAGSQLKEWNRPDGKIVFCNGCWDGLHKHKGHLDCLRYAKSLGDFLVVGMNSDQSVKRLKGESRPLIGQFDRAYSLACYDFVDLLIIFDEDNPYELIKALKPDALVKSDEYKLEDVVGRDIVGDENVYLFPHVKGYSTTQIIDRIKNT